MHTYMYANMYQAVQSPMPLHLTACIVIDSLVQYDGGPHENHVNNRGVASSILTSGCPPKLRALPSGKELRGFTAFSRVGRCCS